MLTLNEIKKKKQKKIFFSTIFALSKCPQKRGLVKKIRVDSPRKPNSAKRAVAKVKLSNNKVILARIKGSGHNLQPFSNVLVTGGRANDVPGVRYSLLKGVLDFSWSEKFIRSKRRSKYGIPKNEY